MLNLNLSSVNTQFIATDEASLPEQKAATRIQAHVRGFLTMKSLSQTIFNQQFDQLVQLKGGVEYQTASGGKTVVWLPKICNRIVMKFSDNIASRIGQMDEIRAVLKEAKSFHLAVPLSKKCNFQGNPIIVEERVPVNTDPYYNWCLYLNNVKAFNSVVRELVRLFSKVGGLGDLHDNNSVHPINQIGEGGGIRFDNFPLYLDGKGEGCVGLIDLEQIGWEHFESGCQTLAKIFPFHVDLIVDEAKKCGRVINKTSLESHAKLGTKILKEGISEHEIWVRKKDAMVETSVFQENSCSILSLSLERKLELMLLVRKMLINDNQGVCKQQNLYRLVVDSSWASPSARGIREMVDDLVQKKESLEWAFEPQLTTHHPIISVDTLAAYITLFSLQYFQDRLPHKDSIPTVASCKKGDEWTVIRDRSPFFEYGDLFNKIGIMITKHQKFISDTFVDIEDMSFPDIAKGQIIEAIMKDLIDHHEIFSFKFLQGGYCSLRY